MILWNIPTLHSSDHEYPIRTNFRWSAQHNCKNIDFFLKKRCKISKSEENKGPKEQKSFENYVKI